ncbi:MAG TPA: retropepsin-like aspartic protease [Caulobacteraceae bacterium]|nr:retropepsin-like aspartic protease [Caulobacteraceae bacterium]
MRRWAFDRRTFLAGGAAVFAAGPAAAIEVEVDEGPTSLIPAPAPYVPPADLRTIVDLYRRMTVPVRVNGGGPFPFVVDTGANQSVISDTLAGQLALARGPEELLNGVAGAQMAPTTTARLDVGGRSEAGVMLSVLPEASIGGLGMLGVDRLTGQVLTLDFAGRRLVIAEARRVRGDPRDIVMTAHRRDGQLTLVDADLAGTPVIAFLDSGAQSTIGNIALRDLAVARHPAMLWDQAPVVSATGQTITAEIADFPGLRIGGMRLPSWPVAFADLHTFELWSLLSRPALMIGVDVLSRFDYVSLDFLRDQVRFRVPSAAQA